MSFWELLVVAIVGLLVVGPEKLPDTIRSSMLWFGRLKRGLNSTRTEFEQQLGLDDIRRELHNEKVLESLRALEQTHKKAADAAHNISNDIGNTIHAEAERIDDELEHDPSIQTTHAQPVDKQ